MPYHHIARSNVCQNAVNNRSRRDFKFFRQHAPVDLKRYSGVAQSRMHATSLRLLSKDELNKALQIPDLSDKKNGLHAINIVVDKVVEGLSKKGNFPLIDVKRSSPVSSVEDEFDNLYFPPDSANRSPIYTRYVTPTAVLRTHTSSMIPKILRELKEKNINDYMVVCPGICYRRDVIDKKHVGEPHQMDIWRVKKGLPKLQRADLAELIDNVLKSVFQKIEYKLIDAQHPYTVNGLQVDIKEESGRWLELLECGEIHPQLLIDAGLDPKHYSGLAMGMGLDRLVMLIKKIDDIRVLRSADPRIKAQMANLNKFVPVSKFPPIFRDLSVSTHPDITEEDICEAIRNELKHDISIIEQVQVLDSVPYNKLLPHVAKRLGMLEGQKNVLLRLVFRSHEKNLLNQEVNQLSERIYKTIHLGEIGYLKSDSDAVVNFKI